MTFTEFVKIHFNNDTQKALQQLAKEKYNYEYEYTATAENLQSILNSMDEKTTNEFLDCWDDEYNKNPKPIQHKLKIITLSNSIGMSPIKVIEAKKNPFAKNVLINTLIMVGCICLLAILLLIGKVFDIQNNIYNNVITNIPLYILPFLSLPTARAIIYALKFRKLKKIITNDIVNTDTFFAASNNGSVIDSKVDEPFATEEAMTSESANDECFEEEQPSEAGPLTRADIANTLIAHYSNKRSKALGVGLTITILFLLFSIIPEARLAIFGALVSFVWGGIFYVDAKIKLKKIDNLDFFITVDTCTNKYVKRSSEDNSIQARYLRFKNTGEYKIDFEYAGMGFDSYIEGSLYDSVDIDDTAYVVRFTNDKKIRRVYPLKFYNINRDEFELSDNNYVPIKNTTVQALMNESIETQQEVLSDRQKQFIDCADKKNHSARVEINCLMVCSVVGLLFVLVGIPFETISALNVFTLPFFFLIQSIIALVVARKTKKAFDEIRSTFAGYYELKHKQNSVGYKALIIIGIDFLIYFLNFIIIIGVHT